MAENIIQHGPEQIDSPAQAGGIVEAVGKGALTMNNEAPTTATQEYLEVLEAAYVPFDRTKSYFVGCVDDREPTPNSSKDLVARMAEQGTEIADPIHEGYVRVGGGVAGMAKAVATTVAIQHGPDALANHSDFENLMHDAHQRLRQTTNVEGALHEKCAAASVGAVSKIAVTEASVQQEGARVFAEYFGGTNVSLDQILKGERVMANHFFGATGEWADYAVSPEGYAADPSSPIAVMQLEGAHANPQETVFVINADPDTISNPDTAIKEWGQAYDMDAAVIAELLMKAYPELHLNPRILLPVLVHTAVAIRGALTGGQPENLSMVLRGDINQAFVHLDKVAADLKK